MDPAFYKKIGPTLGLGSINVVCNIGVTVANVIK